MKDNASGKLVSEWQTALEGATTKPEAIDMTPAISSLLAVKDDDELVRIHSRYLSSILILLISESHPNGGGIDIDTSQTPRRSKTRVDS